MKQPSSCSHHAGHKSAAPAQSIVSGAREYTCPMHPQVHQQQPGNCPICGMALEAVFAQDTEEEAAEYAAIKRRFIVAAVCSLPVVLLAMGGMLPGQVLSELLPQGSRRYLELLFALPVCLWSAWPFYRRGVHSLIARSLNMYTLIALGVSVAFIYSLIATLVPDLFPASFRDATGHVAVYFEAAVVIVTLILLGEVLELRARRQSGAP